ncbi:MAG: DUF559 domain-containing protein [Actinomycetota bacterium]|nr:DUF559 domain-containing protein [Actinomycetota bacterium]
MYSTPADAQLREHSSTHHGLIRREDALRAGLSDRQIRHRLASGALRAVAPNVFVLGGVPVSPEQDLLAAIWAVDGAASHESGAWVHELLDEPPEMPHVATLHDRHRSLHGQLMVVHRPIVLTRRDLTRRKGFAVTTVERTLCDLGAVVDLETVRECCDRALRERLTHPDRLVRRFLQLGGRGRPGSASIRTVLAEIDADVMLLESDLESMLLRLIEAAGLPRPTLQHRVEAGGHRYRLDMAYPELRIAIEADGFAVHGGRRAFEDDHERRTALTVAGWQVLEFTWRQVCSRPDWVVQQIRDALDRAAREKA